MANDCISRERMSEFLAGSLLPEDESQITEHLHGCGDCNQLAFELSDDPAAREILAGAANHDVRRGGEAALVDLQRRLAALALIESAFSDTATLQSGETPSVTTGKWHAEDISSQLPERLGKFQIIRELGAGSFGIVYLAKDTVLDRHVALKLPRSIRLVDPGGQQRFFREAQALARLDHPHIVPLYEAGEHDGTCYLAVAYCNGPTLDKWRRQQGGLVEPENAAEIVLLLAEAVEHAHQQGILHRDIKPANVLLTKVQGSKSKLNEDPNSTRLQTLDFGQWTPKLADFGLAKMSDDQHSSSTVSGAVLGTPDYLSPEQAAGMLDKIGPPTDVYGLGAVLYELLTGQPPIHGASTADTLRRVLVDEPRPPRELASGVAPELEAIVMKCLEKSTVDRYATVQGLAGDLQRFLEGKDVVARPATVLQRLVRWCEQPQRLREAGLTVIAVNIVMCGWTFIAMVGIVGGLVPRPDSVSIADVYRDLLPVLLGTSPPLIAAGFHVMTGRKWAIQMSLGTGIVMTVFALLLALRAVPNPYSWLFNDLPAFALLIYSMLAMLCFVQVLASVVAWMALPRGLVTITTNGL